MSQQEALEALDPTGMLRKLGIPSDHAGESIAADRHLSDGVHFVCLFVLSKRMTWDFLRTCKLLGRSLFIPSG